MASKGKVHLCSGGLQLFGLELAQVALQPDKNLLNSTLLGLNLFCKVMYLSCPCLCRQLSRSSSNLIFDQRSVATTGLSKQVSADLLKNGIDHQNTAMENGSFQTDVNSFRSLYIQRKRKPALEINRGPGRPVGPFPDSDGAVVMRKSQSVHDLVHNGKEMPWC